MAGGQAPLLPPRRIQWLPLDAAGWSERRRKGRPRRSRTDLGRKEGSENCSGDPCLTPPPRAGLGAFWTSALPSGMTQDLPLTNLCSALCVCVCVSLCKASGLPQAKRSPPIPAGPRTVPVARLPEGPALGEDHGHDEVLEAGDEEEGGVLVVLDVVLVVMGDVGRLGTTGRG